MAGSRSWIGEVGPVGRRASWAGMNVARWVRGVRSFLATHGNGVHHPRASNGCCALCNESAVDSLFAVAELQYLRENNTRVYNLVLNNSALLWGDMHEHLGLGRPR